MNSARKEVLNHSKSQLPVNHVLESHSSQSNLRSISMSLTFIKNKSWPISNNGMLKSRESMSIRWQRRLALLNLQLIVRKKDSVRLPKKKKRKGKLNLKRRKDFVLKWVVTTNLKKKFQSKKKRKMRR